MRIQNLKIYDNYVSHKLSLIDTLYNCMHYQTACPLTISHIQICFDASVADDFESIVTKGDTAHTKQFLFFVKILSSIFNDYTFIYIDCPSFMFINIDMYIIGNPLTVG